MKIDPRLLDYIKRNTEAIDRNPVRTWPAYEVDPIGCWRYFARCFGHGLGEFSKDQVLSEIKALYGNWFIRHELSHRIPDVSASMFVEWIMGAMDEAMRHKNDTPQE